MSVSDKRCFCRNVDCIVKTRASSEPGEGVRMTRVPGEAIRTHRSLELLPGGTDPTSPLKLMHGGSLSGAAFPVVRTTDRGHSGSDHPGFPLGPLVYGTFEINGHRL